MAKLDFWVKDRVTAYKFKRSGGYARKKYSYSVLREMGLVFLKDSLNPRQLELLPAKGQHIRKAEC